MSAKAKCIAIAGKLRHHSLLTGQWGSRQAVTRLLYSKGPNFFEMRHIISILMQNEAGALTRVTSMFSSRGYNIESLSVAPTENPEVSRLSMVTTGSDEVIDQINKQLFKLVDVVRITDMTMNDHYERELLLMKVKLNEKANVADIVSAAGALVLDATPEHYTVQLTGSGMQIDDFMQMLGANSETLAVVRSGSMAIGRGTNVLSAEL